MTVGIDAKLQLLSNGIYDIKIGDDGDIETEDAFDTAILVSLFTDRRATGAEVPRSPRRRGWIGNESTPGIEIGSKLWLFEQARITATTLSRIADAAQESLQWMVDVNRGLVHSVTASAKSTPTGVVLDIIITRPNSQVEHRYYDLWENTGVS